MTRDEFEALVKSLEAARNRRPKLFMWNTVLLVAGAYGYLLAVFLLAVAFLAFFLALVLLKPNAGTIKLAIFAVVLFGGFALAIVKGLWVRLDAPDGMTLKPEDAPALFGMLEELREKLDCAHFHEVQLVSDHNAAVVQVPRLGIFGWHRNYLLIGLPLLQGLAPAELKSVLAHEFAHSSRGHGRFGNWLYRLRQSWERIVHEVARQQNRGTVVLTAFLKFFWPRFNGRAFVLSRANEYEADDWARRLTSAKDTANALLRVSVNDRFLDEKFWPALFQKANSQSAPPGNVYAAAAMGLRVSAREQEAGKWAQQAFMLETNTADTHPSLKDRLKALGVAHLRVEDLPPLERTAGEALLGDRLTAVTEQLSTQWSQQVGEVWKSRHHEALKLASELENLGGDEPDAAVLWKKASVILDLKGDEAAAELLEQVLEKDPAHVAANFVKGRLLLKNDNALGVEFIERSIRADEMLTMPGCEILYGYYARTGQTAKIRELENTVDAFREEQAQAQQERENMSASDTYISAELTPEQTEQLCEAIATEKDIESAAVARKVVKFFPKQPAIVIALKIKAPIWKIRSSDANQEVVNRVGQLVQIPAALLFIVEKELVKPGKKVFAVDGAVFYQREKKSR